MTGVQTCALPIYGAVGVAIPAAAADTLTLTLSENAWNGDAQCLVSLDGVQLGGVQTITASRALGASQRLSFTGSYGTGPHTLSVSFLNDAWGGTAATDRNLYLTGVELNGKAVTGAARSLMSNGAVSVAIPATAAAAATVANAAAPDTVVFNVSEDAWNGDAQCVLTLDGVQLGGVQTVTALQALGTPQRLVFTGSFGPGPHTVGVTFLNDAWGGTAATDRNLHLNSVEFNGQLIAASSRTLWSAGTAEVAIPAVAQGASVGVLAEALAPPEQALLPMAA